MPVAKIWSSDLSKRKAVLVLEWKLEHLIEKANEKDIEGSFIYLQDGTQVEEDEILKELQNEILIIGPAGWKPVKDQETVETKDTEIELKDQEKPHARPDSPSTSKGDHVYSDSGKTNEKDAVFEIPYHKLPTALLDKLKDPKLVLCSSEVNTLIRTVTDELINKRKLLTRATYRVVVASNLCEKFPQLYDRDEDSMLLIGNGYHTIFKKIEERIHYLQRPNKVSLLKNDKKKDKATINLKAGCKEWEPEHENIEDAEVKKDWLCSNANIKERDASKVESYMRDTYSQQRKFLNSMPTVHSILIEWPVLLEYDHMTKHFDRLCGINSKQCLDTLTAKTEDLKKILKTINHKQSQQDTLKYQGLYGILWNISAYFNEDLSQIMQQCDDSTRDEVQKLSKLPAPNIIFSESDNIYYLLIESNIVSEAQSLPAAVQLIFAAYYNFNLEYPKGSQNTLEFIQRYVFKINPDQGSKVRKGHTLSKVLSLMNKLKISKN